VVRLSTFGARGREAAPTGKDADPQECLWHFKWSTTQHVGDRRVSSRVECRKAGH